MSTQADSIALSPLWFGEAFIAGAAAMQKQIAGGMLAAFDAITDAMNESLQASAKLVDDIGHAETPVDVVAAGCAWTQGRAARALGWLRSLTERLASSWSEEAPAAPAALPAAVRQAPVVSQAEIRMRTKPPAGKLHPTPIVVAKAAKKPARPAAKS
jgi:hypothetical protein